MTRERTSGCGAQHGSRKGSLMGLRHCAARFVVHRAKNAIRDTQYPIRYILFYKCRKYSTNRPCFVQNKANLQKSQMDVKPNISRDYEKKSKWTLGENKPKQSQYQNGCYPRSSAKRSSKCLSSWIRIRAAAEWVVCKISL